VIAWLKGVLREKQPPWLLIDVGGIGYELQASMTTFSALPSTGTDVALFAHQVVREDAHQLFGFAERSERDVFRQLLKVNGVGAKVALAILSGMDAATLGRCVLEGDTTRLTRLPGIGKKTAERLVIEMRDRLGNLPGGGELGSPLGGASGNGATDPASEAVSALIALGLKGPEASRRVSAIDCGATLADSGRPWGTLANSGRFGAIRARRSGAFPLTASGIPSRPSLRRQDVARSAALSGLAMTRCRQHWSLA
jgi:Holliday junction DNA helicase RuvA